MKTCLSCGKEFRDPKHPDRKYCSLRCATQSQKRRPARKCKHCGKAIDVKASSKKQYCSLDCAYKDRQSDPSKHETRICPRCGKEFECYAYRPTEYCSQHCAQTIPEGRVTKQCETCGKSYTITRFFATKRTSRYCSKKCQDEAYSVRQQGPNNSNWKGGPQPFDYTRGSNWFAQRRKALKRDGYKCQICGSRKRLSVHHIVKWRTFNGDYLAANQLSNLITLCKRCHTRVDKGGLPCPRPLL